MKLILSLLGLLSACAMSRYSSFGVGPSGAGGSFIAAGVSSAVSRTSGGCYADCPPGTKCNRETGVCDELPCRGRCAHNEHCVRGICQPGPEPTLEVIRDSDAPRRQA